MAGDDSRSEVPADELSASGVAGRVKAAVIHVGAAFGHDAQFADTARSFGLDEQAFYFGARAGVLGPVDADVVTAVCGFFAPERVRPAWQAATASGPLTRLVAADVALSVAWSRRHLRVRDTERLAELLERVVDHADASGKPLFAAWRALATPVIDAPARAGLALLRLREHRGAAHLIAVTAAGLSPLAAILAGPGPAKAHANGWPAPYPDVDASDARVAAAERTTDELAGAAYTALTTGERVELIELVDSLPNRPRSSD